MSRSKGVQTDETYCSENTLPIIFMNNLKEPILTAGIGSGLMKKQIKPRGSIQLPKETIEARDVIQRYYEEHDMKPFFNDRPGYKPNLETPWKKKNQSVRYSHIKPRINTNIQRRSNDRSISYSEKSRTIQVKKSGQYRRIVSKTNTPKLSLYLKPYLINKEEFILPRIQDKEQREEIGKREMTEDRENREREDGEDREESKIDYIHTEPVIPEHRSQQSVKELKNESCQTIQPEQSRKILSYEVINTTIRPTPLKTIPPVLDDKIEQRSEQQVQKEDIAGISRIRPRRNSLQSQAFSVMTKPNFDLGRVVQKVVANNINNNNLNNNEVNNTNRGSTQSTSFNWRKNIHPQITEQKMGDMVKEFKPKSDLLKDADVTTFKIKKYKNGVYFGQLISDPAAQEQTEIKSGLGCIFYYNGRLYEGEFERDFKNGKGYELYPDSSYYHGDFKAGHKEGKGVFVWNNGEMYWGEWAQGKKHGSGTWKGVEGSKQSYFGQWYNGKPHGFGVLTNAVGDVYEGEFKLSVKDGKGTERFANGDVYVGQYVKGRRNGPKQTMYYKNGSVYVGEYCNNVRHGKGLLKGGDQKPMYQGQWRNDKRCGEGMLWMDNVGVYQGNFQNDLMHGIGKIVGYDHRVRNGYWVNGKQLFDKGSEDRKAGGGTLEIINERQRSKTKNYNTLNPHNRSVEIQKTPRIVSHQKRNLRQVRSENKFADLKRVYLTKHKHSNESKLHKRACGCSKKK